MDRVGYRAVVPSPSEPAPRPHPGMTAWERRGRVVTAVVLAGVAAGLIGIAMAMLLEVFESLFYGVSEGSLPQRVAAAPSWRRVLAPAAGGAVAGALWWWLRATGGVTGVEDALSDPTGRTASRMGILRPFADAVVQVLTVGSGNSVGREGAPRLAAGAVAARLGSWLRLDAATALMLIAAAAGAGLGAMYNTPLGGAAYAVEIVMIPGMRRRGVLLAVPVSCVATVVSWLHSGGQPAFQARLETPAMATVLGLVLLVPVAAGLGVAARTLWAWVKRHRLGDRWILPVAIGGAGLATGLVSLWLVMVPGNGRDAMAFALASDAQGMALAMLLGVVVLKPLLTTLTLGAGATGGLLAPSFGLGASAGAALAGGAQLMGFDVSVTILAFVGAAVVLAVTQKAPVFGAVFVWELVRPEAWALGAVCMAVVAALLLARGSWLDDALPRLLRRQS